jgi:hypothetical protein
VKRGRHDDSRHLATKRTPPPHQTLFRRPGDFCSIDELLPSLDDRRLERVNSWAGHITYPSNFKDPRGALYDQANDKFVIVGSGDAIPPTDRVANFTIAHDDLSKSSVQTASNSPTAIGGTHKINHFCMFNAWWFVAADGDV